MERRPLCWLIDIPLTLQLRQRRHLLHTLSFLIVIDLLIDIHIIEIILVIQRLVHHLSILRIQSIKSLGTTWLPLLWCWNKDSTLIVQRLWLVIVILHEVSGSSNWLGGHGLLVHVLGRLLEVLVELVVGVSLLRLEAARLKLVWRSRASYVLNAFHIHVNWVHS